MTGKGSIGSKNNQVYSNYVHMGSTMNHSIGGYGITIGGTGGTSAGHNTTTSAYNCIVYNNLIISESPGFINRGLGASATEDCAFINNVVIGTNIGVHGQTYYAQVPDQSKDIHFNRNLTIKNNIIVNSVVASYYFSPNNLTGTPDFDYNLYYSNNPPSIPHPTEPNSVYADPQFVNINSDWHLQPTSPAIDAGTAHTFIGYSGQVINIAKDWDRLTRVIPWDMGVYEFNGNNCPTINGSITTTNESTPNANDGTINLTPTGGTPPYTFIWSNGANTEDLNNLTGGTYLVTITDANGCETIASATVNTTQCPAISATATVSNESAPNANDGVINITPTGGTAPYTFKWSNGATSEDINGLAGGAYQVTITDSNGCETFETFVVNTILPQGCAGGTTYYVDPILGNDNNSGASNEPFASMWKVGQVVLAGDIAIFADGNYTEPMRVDFVNGGTADCPIILQAANQHQAKIVFTSGAQGAQSIWLNQSWITIDGFDLSKQVKTNSPSNQVIRVYGNSSNNGHYCTIKNNRIHNAFGAGIKSYQTRGLTIDNNILFNFTDDAIDLVEIDSSTISNNEVFDVQRHGIMIGGGSKSGKVFNNYVHYDGACCMNGYGIFFGSDPPFGTIECENSLAYNNIVVSSTPGAMKAGMSMGSSTDCAFNNNVIVGPENGRHFITVQSIPFKNLAFKNNIVMNCTQNASSGTILMNSGNPEFHYNCYYNNGGVDPIEINSIYTDPQFVNPLSDWTLQSTSPAIDRGVDYTFTGYYGESIDVTKAYDGVTRAPVWDMGVYESPSSSIYVNFDIRLWLEGAFDPSINKMHTDLIDFAPFPSVQPYQGAPWNYPGTEGTGWANLNYPTGTVDWVKVEFRSGIDPSTEVASTAAILLDDGSMYYPNPESLTINQGSSYYIVIEHRNHMAIMTPVSVPLVGNSLMYDFRGANSYSVIGTGQKELSPGVWAMVVGDGDQLADVSGYDVNLADIILWTLENGMFNTYSRSDFNMDGDVNAQDKILWSMNNGLFSSVKK